MNVARLQCPRVRHNCRSRRGGLVVVFLAVIHGVTDVHYACGIRVIRGVRGARYGPRIDLSGLGRPRIRRGGRTSRGRLVVDVLAIFARAVRVCVVHGVSAFGVGRVDVVRV